MVSFADGATRVILGAPTPALPCNSSAIQGLSEKLLRSPPVALAVAVAAGVRQADVYAQSPSIHRAPDG